MGLHLDRTLRIFEKTLGATLPKDEKSLPVIHFAEREDYVRLCEGLGLERYAIDGYGCYAPKVPSRPIIVQGLRLATLRHEAAHQFADRALGPGLRKTPWIAEGLGALFEAHPPEDLDRFQMYRKGRAKILDPAFSLQAFVTNSSRFEATYDVGPTLHWIHLFGPKREAYIKWLKDLARGKARPADLADFLDESWQVLEEGIREFCRSRPPIKRKGS